MLNDIIINNLTELLADLGCACPMMPTGKNSFLYE